MKRLVKHQPERLDSVVGFACACSVNCGCNCNCGSNPCTCTCTGTAAAFTSQYSGPQSNPSGDNSAAMSSGAYNTTYSGVSSNVSLWG